MAERWRTTAEIESTGAERGERTQGASLFTAFLLDDLLGDEKLFPRIRDDQRASDLVLRCERRPTSFRFSVHPGFANASGRAPETPKKYVLREYMDGEKLRLLGDSIARTVAAIDRTEHQLMALLREFSMARRVWWRGCRIEPA